MKTSTKVLMALAIACIALGACKKKKKVAEETTPSSSLSCKIDGVEYKASSFDNTILRDGSYKRVDIRGKVGSKQIILTMGDPSGETAVKVATYYMDQSKNSPASKIGLGTYLIGSNFYSGSFDEDGSIVVTESSDGRVAGTFEFMMVNAYEDTVYVTDGKFDAKY